MDAHQMTMARVRLTFFPLLAARALGLGTAIAGPDELEVGSRGSAGEDPDRAGEPLSAAEHEGQLMLARGHFQTGHGSVAERPPLKEDRRPWRGIHA